MSADMIIGVDFGMTYTEKTDPERPKLLQSWPGKEGKTENKVLTSLVYHGNKLKSWGFLCDRPDQEEHPNPQRKQYFKLWLDPAHLTEVWPDDDGPSHEEVRKWFIDYLKRLYSHIERSMCAGPFEKQWKSKVDFVFSVPTTWKTQKVLNSFEQCIRDAGFDHKKRHKFSIGLTEAEAAAIHTFSSKDVDFDARDLILVCDAGGGTSDAALLEVVHKSKDLPRLKQYGVDSGRLSLLFSLLFILSFGRGLGKPIGSVNIDKRFIELVSGRLSKALEKVPSLADDEPQWAEDTAWEMAQGEFQYHKCAFGTIEGTHEKFRIKIPDFPSSKNIPDAFIEKKHMLFTRKDMNNLFDEQISGIYSILDEQIRYLKKDKKQLKHLVLSGGLGSSAYVKKKLQERYVNNTKAYPNAKHLKIYTADEPQIAVVQGLVVNHAQQRESGVATLKSRNSPVSYGVLCQEPYDKEKHVGYDLWKDDIDGKMYAVDVIRWFINKGDAVEPDTHKSHEFKRKFLPNELPQDHHWKSTVVISWRDLKYRPKRLDDGVKKLCTLTSDTSSLDARDFQNIAPWYNPWGVAYHVAYYEIRVNFEVGKLLFEVWCNGAKLSKDQPIHVRWDEGAELAKPENVGRAKDTFVR
ncbi:MAG: hypothetical protein Q9191_006937 [Dirinaria sp. TL-2023a]